MSNPKRIRFIACLGLVLLVCAALGNLAPTLRPAVDRPIETELQPRPEIAKNARPVHQADSISVTPTNAEPFPVRTATLRDSVSWSSEAVENASPDADPAADLAPPSHQPETWASEVILDPTSYSAKQTESVPPITEPILTGPEPNSTPALSDPIKPTETRLATATKDSIDAPTFDELPFTSKGQDQTVEESARESTPESSHQRFTVHQGRRVTNPFTQSTSANLATNQPRPKTPQTTEAEFDTFIASRADSNDFPIAPEAITTPLAAPPGIALEPNSPLASPKYEQPQSSDIPIGESSPTQPRVALAPEFNQPTEAVLPTSSNNIIQPPLTSPADAYRRPNRYPLPNSILPNSEPPRTKPPSTTTPPGKQPTAPNYAIKPRARDLQITEQFVLAGQPKTGGHWKHDPPSVDPRADLIEPFADDFSPDPTGPEVPYNPYVEMEVYSGKTHHANQRPLVELGRPWYQLGQLSPGFNWLGKHNNVAPQFLIFGDARTAIASNTQQGDNVSQVAFEVNLDFDLKITSTERFHMFMAPVDNGKENTRWLLDDGVFVDKFDANIDFGYFEGDLGAIVGGFTNKTLPFDLPFTMGIIPMVIQNGVWMEDAFLGLAATIPARNSPRLDISNMDTTFFAGFDKINSDAFPEDDSAARMYGFATFIDALNGYIELDYAYLEDRTINARSYHNIGMAFTRRYGRLISNSTRVIINAGQATDIVDNSADGVLLISENSLITGAPSTLVPYMNFFAGFDRPQSAARAAQAEGVLRNTGILFESDGMTQYPTLDPTANDTYGGAIGINLIADDFSQQLVLEMAALGVMGDAAVRNAAGPQYGLGFRYQLPLSNALIFRTDGMLGFFENQNDVRGLRFELRKKF